MENPRVTFLIAHHNYQEYLGQAIQSALNQTYANIHICVIDDCSQDQQSVRDIIEQFDKPFTQENDGNLLIESGEKITTIYISDSAHGPSYARNRGIEYFWEQTDIFAVLDSDDENYPTKIEKCVNVIQRHPTDIGVVYCDHLTLNTTTNTSLIEYRRPFDLYLLMQECIVHSGGVINKLALEYTRDNNQFYDEMMRTCEDYDLWVRIAEKMMIVHIAEPLSLVRVQPKNSTDTVRQEIWNDNYQRVFQKANLRQHGA